MVTDMSRDDFDSACFFNRVYQLPVVTAGIQQVLNAYQKSKEYRVVGPTLNWAEEKAKYAYEKGEPILNKLNGPISQADRVACMCLEKLEGKYPAVTKTPGEIMEITKGYYDQTRVKAGVDRAMAAKAYSAEKLAGLLNYMFDNADYAIDRYVAEPGARPTRKLQGEDPASYIKRLHSMYGKASQGVKARTVANYAVLREQALEQMEHLKQSMIMLDYVRNNAQWANDKINAAQRQSAQLLAHLKTQAQTYGTTTEVFTLNLTRRIARNVVLLTAALARSAGPHLPPTGEKSLHLAVDYAEQVSSTLEHTDTLHDLKDEVVRQTHERVAAVHTAVVGALDSLAQYVPEDWSFNEPVMDFEGLDDLIGFDRDARSPQHDEEPADVQQHIPPHVYVNGDAAHYFSDDGEM